MIPPEARARLAEQMEERRLELRLTWREVSEAGGISYEVIRNLRNGRGTGIAPLTKRGIEAGLQWPSGTVDRVLAGEPAPDPLLTEAQRFAVEMGADPSGALLPYIRAVEQEVARAGEGASGAQIFRGNPMSESEARVWDAAGASREAGILLVATMRAHRAQHDAGQHNGRSGTAGLAPLLTLAGR